MVGMFILKQLINPFYALQGWSFTVVPYVDLVASGGGVHLSVGNSSLHSRFQLEQFFLCLHSIL